MTDLIEAVIVAHLLERLETGYVFAERPKNPPKEYYIIEKTAAAEENHISMATVAVQSISSVSMLNAASMSKAAEKAMKALPELPDIGRCQLNSAYNFTDPETREYRYQAVFDIYYMEGD